MMTYSEDSLSLSAVVCTRNCQSRILETLLSLKHQTLDASKFEVVLVDNASDDGSSDYLKQKASELGFRYVFEPELGLSTARNTGIQHANGELVYFTDDDAVVPAHVLELLVNDLKEQSADIVGGPVHGLWESTPPDWFLSSQWRRVSLLSYGSEAKFLEYPDILIGCNMGFRKQVFEEFGLFDHRFGRKGNSLLGNEERVLEWRILKAGGRVYYNPAAYVFHKVPEKRVDMRYLRDRSYAGAKSNLAMNELTGSRDSMLDRLSSRGGDGGAVGNVINRLRDLVENVRFRRSVLRRGIRFLRRQYEYESMLQKASRDARVEYLNDK